MLLTLAMSAIFDMDSEKHKTKSVCEIVMTVDYEYMIHRAMLMWLCRWMCT